MTRFELIGNPAAGRGRTAGVLDAVATALRADGHEATVSTTSGPGHAVTLARRALASGAEVVVAVGGDGTVNEVVNGLLDPRPDRAPTLGIVPTGSGCDYVKTFDIPTEPDEAAQALLAGRTTAVDVGAALLGDVRRLFVNIAEVGFGPAVVERASRLPAFLGGMKYLVSFLATLPGFTRPHTIVASGGRAREVTAMNVVVAIGKVFGGGMRIAPDADPSDGAFDVQIHEGTKLAYVRAIPRVFRGTHLPHPAITAFTAAEVEVRCEPAALVEADGEVLGPTPVRFEIIPAAIRVVVGAARIS